MTSMIFAQARSASRTRRPAQARAELAKQAMNGIRLVINAQKFLENKAISVQQ